MGKDGNEEDDGGKVVGVHLDDRWRTKVQMCVFFF
jgi:hypothetical protein